MSLWAGFFCVIFLGDRKRAPFFVRNVVPDIEIFAVAELGSSKFGVDVLLVVVVVMMVVGSGVVSKKKTPFQKEMARTIENTYTQRFGQKLPQAHLVQINGRH